MPIKVYIAADSAQQPIVKELRSHLHTMGLEVTSRWIDAKLEAFHPATEEELQTAAELNFSDIQRAAFLIAWNPCDSHRQGTGGRHVELGYALRSYKMVVYVGEEKENVFHRSVGVRAWVDNSGYTNLKDIAQQIANAVTLLWDGATQKTSER